jgi:hypothetical protein
VDLEDDDPEVFSAYLECVYFGIEAIKFDMECEDPDKPNCDSEKQEPTDTFEWSHGECQKRCEQYLKQDPARDNPYLTVCATQILWLVKTYLQADKLQDCETANLIIDEIIRFSEATQRNPTYEVVSLVYGNTVHGHPLRKLMRDYFVHWTTSSDYLDLHGSDICSELLRDIAVEFLRAKDYRRNETVEDVNYHSIDKTMCDDVCHQHSGKRCCVPDPETLTNDETGSTDGLFD